MLLDLLPLFADVQPTPPVPPAPTLVGGVYSGPPKPRRLRPRAGDDVLVALASHVDEHTFAALMAVVQRRRTM
jgi:hypothetical protein